MKHPTPKSNWIMALADAIESAQAGDIIEVHTEARKELAEQARQRMCPDKVLIFSIGEDETT